MSFWKTSGTTYEGLVSLEEEELELILSTLNRQDIIEWLMWNDRNGIYSDELSIAEFGKVMSKEEGLEIILRQVQENRIDLSCQ